MDERPEGFATQGEPPPADIAAPADTAGASGPAAVADRLSGATPAGLAAPADPAGSSGHPDSFDLAAPTGLPWGFLAFFIGFGAFYLASLVITGAVSTNTTDPDSVQSSLTGPVVLLALLPNLLLGLAPAVVSWRRANGPRRDFGIRFTRQDLSIGFTCGVVALAIGLVVNYVLQGLVFHNQAQQSAAEELGQLSGGRTGWLGLALLFVVFVAPLNEEMLVRGALWGALQHYRVPRLMILALTSLVFAFLHQEPTLTLALFCQGLAIGTARMRTGRIGASMIAHATNNVLPAVVLWFLSKP